MKVRVVCYEGYKAEEGPSKRPAKIPRVRKGKRKT